MEQNLTLTLPASLEQVRDQFEDWRRTRSSRREPIPGPLWKAAVKLSDSYSIHSISKALRLNYSDLKDRFHKQSAPEKVKTLPAAGFIGLGCSHSHFECEYNIEMQDATGLKLKMADMGGTRGRVGQGGTRGSHLKY